MTQDESKLFSSIGFVTVVDGSTHGLFGGFLVLNPSARPLEFHCTVPVKISKAQEILYGSTLKPYIYGEQIAQTLINQTAKKPEVIFTNLPEVLAVQQFVTLPVLLTTDSQSNNSLSDAEGKPLEQIEIGGKNFAGYPLVLQQHQALFVALEQCLESIEIDEPFTRINEAILEAQKTGKKAA